MNNKQGKRIPPWILGSAAVILLVAVLDMFILKRTPAVRNQSAKQTPAQSARSSPTVSPGSPAASGNEKSGPSDSGQTQSTPKPKYPTDEAWDKRVSEILQQVKSSDDPEEEFSLYLDALTLQYIEYAYKYRVCDQVLNKDAEKDAQVCSQVDEIRETIDAMSAEFGEDGAYVAFEGASSIAGDYLDDILGGTVTMYTGSVKSDSANDYWEVFAAKLIEMDVSLAVLDQSEPTPASPANLVPASTPDTSSDQTVFSTDYFSVTIPSDWKGKVKVEQGENSIGLYEIQNNLAGYGGKLCVITCMTESEYRAYEMDHKLLGALTTPDWESYYLAVIYPNDVPCRDDLIQNWSDLQQQLPDIYASIEPLNGCTFTPQVFQPTPSVSYDVPEHQQVLFLDVYGNASSGNLYLGEWYDGEWHITFDTTAYIGSNGVTYNKREGDHCTPAGSFNLLYYLSTEVENTALTPVFVRDGDVWVDDSSSSYYNTLQSSSLVSKDWSSSENIYKQLSNDSVYIYFDFNGDGRSRYSADPNCGSCLFICGVPSGGNLQTGYGDIKISLSDMRDLLELLDVTLNPMIVIENDPEWIDGVRYFSDPDNQPSIPW